VSKHPLAVVCTLAFLAGGAAAVVLNYPPRDTVGVRAVAEKTAAPRPTPAAETGTAAEIAAEGPHVEGRAVSTDVGNSASRPGDVGVEPSHTEGDVGEAAKPPGGLRDRAAAGGRTVESARPPRLR
jgi:hypothetical protein